MDTSAELIVFSGHCGHSWIGCEQGSYACAVCGCHDGDHNIAGTQRLAVQLDGWGGWNEILEAVYHEGRKHG